MTVNSTISSAVYVGDGVSVTFPVPFYFLADSHLSVTSVNTDTQAATTLVLDTDYSVAGAGVQSGGSITLLTAAPASNIRILIFREVPVDQQVDYTPNDKFPAEVTEQALDKITMILQEISSRENSSIRYPVSEYGTDGTLPIAPDRALGVLAFDETGRQTIVPLPASVGAGDLKNESWTDGVDFTSGTSTQLTLSRAYGTKANLGILVMAGVAQDPNSYSLINNGTTLEFDAVIPLGIDRIWCVGGTTLSIWLPPDRSVDDDKLAWGDSLGRMCDSVAAMAALDPGVYTRAFPTGYYSAQDGGGGRSFVYSAGTSHALANGGTIIASTSAAACWLMTDTVDPISVRHFGAKCDGVTNDAAAFNAFVTATGLTFAVSPLLPGGILAGNILATRALIGDLKATDLAAPTLNGGPFSGDISLIINGGFDVWSLGTSFTLGTHLQALADGWNFDFNGTVGTATIIRQHISSAGFGPNRVPLYGARVQQSVAGAGNTFYDLSTQIEGVRNYAGQKVTIAFDAVSNTGSPVTLTAVKTEQYFGSGGSPSASAFNTSNPVTIGTTMATYSVTFDMASIAGKTLGTNADDTLDVIFTLPLNQAFDLTITNARINVGANALPMPPYDPAVIANKCARRIQSSYDDSVAPGTTTTNGCFSFVAGVANPVVTIQLKTPMRTPPAVVLYNPRTGASGTWDNQATAVAASLNTNGMKNITIALAGCTVGTVVNGHYLLQDPLI